MAGNTIETPAIGTAETTLYHVLARRLADSADKPWILSEERAFSYRDIDRMANRLANGLARLGVEPGHTVLLMLNNSIDFVALWCALGKLGAIEVPVNCSYKGQILARVMSDSRARLVIADDEYLPRFRDIAAELSGIDTIVVHGAEVAEAPLKRARLIRYAGILDELDTFATTRLVPWDTAAIMYTSGTTGPSKGVMISHGHAYEYARGVIDMIEIEHTDIYYAPLPLFHIAGQWAVLRRGNRRGDGCAARYLQRVAVLGNGAPVWRLLLLSAGRHGQSSISPTAGARRPRQSAGPCAGGAADSRSRIVQAAIQLPCLHHLGRHRDELPDSLRLRSSQQQDLWSSGRAAL
jgi:hypothetical protein